MPLPDFRLIRLLPLAALVLTACSVTTPKGPGKSPDSPQWRQHQQDVRNLNQYQTRGSFAYISDQQKVYARFFWQQTGQDRYRLLLTNPLGSTELELNAQPGNVQLVDNKGQRYTSDDAEEMIGKLTGMPIPLNSLRQWILGLPGMQPTTNWTINIASAKSPTARMAKTGKLFTVVMTQKLNLRCQPIWNSPTVVNASS